MMGDLYHHSGYIYLESVLLQGQVVSIVVVSQSVFRVARSSGCWERGRPRPHSERSTLKLLLQWPLRGPPRSRLANAGRVPSDESRQTDLRFNRTARSSVSVHKPGPWNQLDSYLLVVVRAPRCPHPSLRGRWLVTFQQSNAPCIAGIRSRSR